MATGAKTCSKIQRSAKKLSTVVRVGGEYTPKVLTGSFTRARVTHCPFLSTWTSWSTKVPRHCQGVPQKTTTRATGVGAGRVNSTQAGTCLLSSIHSWAAAFCAQYQFSYSPLKIFEMSLGIFLSTGWAPVPEAAAATPGRRARFSPHS